MSIHPYRNYFKEFKGNHNVFVETGSYMGDSIELARQAGFRTAFTMDIEASNINRCIERFKDKKINLNAYYGDSALRLCTMMELVRESALIWLDAHSQLFDDEPTADHPFPLLMELEQLKQHPIKSHTILIDDILILTHPDVTGWPRQTIEAKVLEINSAYKISYLSNPVVNNIMLAHV